MLINRMIYGVPLENSFIKYNKGISEEIITMAVFIRLPIKCLFIIQIIIILVEN